MEKIIRAYCPQCSDYNDCPYRLRSLESKCIKLDDIACGYELAEKDLIPLINRLCESILFDWEDMAEFARKIQSQIKEEKK